MIHYTNTTLPDSPQPLRILHHRKLQILRLVRHPGQPRILARDFISHRRCQPFQSPCHLERLVQVLVQLIFQLVVRGGRVKLVPRAGVFARPLLARHGFGRGRGGVWRRVGSCAESFAGVLDVHEGFGAIHAFHGVALVDLVFLRLPFGFLPFSTVSHVSLCVYIQNMHTLFQTMAGRKMLLLRAFSSVALSSARWLLALAMSRYRSELAIRSAGVSSLVFSTGSSTTHQTGQRAWRSYPSPTLQPASPTPPHSCTRISRMPHHRRKNPKDAPRTRQTILLHAPHLLLDPLNLLVFVEILLHLPSFVPILALSRHVCGLAEPAKQLGSRGVVGGVGVRSWAWVTLGVWVAACCVCRRGCIRVSAALFLERGGGRGLGFGIGIPAAVAASSWGCIRISFGLLLACGRCDGGDKRFVLAFEEAHCGYVRVGCGDAMEGREMNGAGGVFMQRRSFFPPCIQVAADTMHAWGMAGTPSSRAFHAYHTCAVRCMAINDPPSHLASRIRLSTHSRWRFHTTPRRPPMPPPLSPATLPPAPPPPSTARWTTSPRPPTCSPSCPACPPRKCISSTSPPPSSTSTATPGCESPPSAVSRSSSTASATTACTRGSMASAQPTASP